MQMINRDRLRELRSEIGDDDFDEVATVFLEEIAETLAALAPDPARATAEDFHGLRGSALNLGFISFAEACLAAENKVKAGIVPDLVRLDWLYRESLVAFGPDLPSFSV